MTITTENRRAGPYIGNGTVEPYPFGFKVFEPSDVAVYSGYGNTSDVKLQYGPHYSVVLNDNQNAHPGGVVNLVSPLEVGFRIVIVSEVPYLQETNITNFGNFHPAILNDVHDRAVILIQQLLEIAFRAIKVPATSDLSPEEYLDKYSEMLDGKVAMAEGYADAASQSAGGSAASAVQSAGSAQYSKDSAQQIHNEFLRVMEALKNITGFAGATQSFHGLRVGNDMRLYFDKSEDGDVMKAENYDYMAALPVEARLYMESGRLMLELPYTT